MFYYANSFNQPVAAWDVGKVTNMEVRRCPRLGWVLLRTQLPRGVARACVCAGAAQDMFYYANSFNQPVAAWDVGKVTNMEVRRCPRLGRVLLLIQLAGGVARAVRVCWRGAGYVHWI